MRKPQHFDCEIDITDEQMDAIHEKRCTSLILSGNPLRVGMRIQLKTPSGLRDDVLVRHVEVSTGFYVVSIVPDDMISYNDFFLIRVLRIENDELIKQNKFLTQKPELKAVS